MVGDPGDKWAYRIAVGALGLAALTALIGAIVVVALQGGTSTTVSEITVKLNDGVGVEQGRATSTTTAIKSTTPFVTSTSTGGENQKKASVATTGRNGVGAEQGTAASTNTSKDSATRSTVSTSSEEPKTVSLKPTGLYVLGGALGGALLGILIPLPWRMRLRGTSDSCQDNGNWFISLMPILLLLALGWLLVEGAIPGEVPSDILGAAIGGAAVGLCVPSPAVR